MNDKQNEQIIKGRRALVLGAIGASTILTIRPALAQATGSVLTCSIPIPDPARSGQYIAADGSVVAPGTPGSFAPSGRPFTGEEVRAALYGQALPGTSYAQHQAYMHYIQRLQYGQSGFTCFASMQMPGR